MQIAPVPTGLSEEDDAARLIALEFNSSLLYCPNCEVSYENDRCPRCLSRLQPQGTPPLSTKRKHT